MWPYFAGSSHGAPQEEKASSLKRKEWLGSIFATYTTSRKMDLNFCYFPNFSSFSPLISFSIRPVASSTSVFCVFCRHFSSGQSPVVKWQWNRASHDVSEFLILQYFFFLRQKRENVDGPTVVYPWGLRNCIGDDSKYPGQGDYHEGSTAEVAVCVRLTNSTKAPNTNLQSLFWSHNMLSM